MSTNELRERYRQVLDRMKFEEGLIVNRTTSILMFNSLMAAVFSFGSAEWLNLMAGPTVIMMVTIDLLWFFRGRSASRFIDILNNEFDLINEDLIPYDEVLHRKYIKEKQRSRTRVPSTKFVAMILPLALAVWWFCFLVVYLLAHSFRCGTD